MGAKEGADGGQWWGPRWPLKGTQRRRLRWRRVALLVGAAAVVLPATASAANRIYWASECGSIEVGNLDGSGTAAPLANASSEGGPCGVAIDPATDKIYWANFSSGTIRVANLDGTGTASTLIDGARAAPAGWRSTPPQQDLLGQLLRIPARRGRFGSRNLDGSGTAATLFGSESGPSGVAIDPAGEQDLLDQPGPRTTNGAVRARTWTARCRRDAVRRRGQPDRAGDRPGGRQDLLGQPRLVLQRSRRDQGRRTSTARVPPRTLFGSEAGPAGVAIDPGEQDLLGATSAPALMRVANLDGTGTASDLFSGPGLLELPGAAARAGRRRAPVISGEAKVGEELSCSNGDWAPDLLGAFLFRAPRPSFEYRWLRGGNGDRRRNGGPRSRQPSPAPIAVA